MPDDTSNIDTEFLEQLSKLVGTDPSKQALAQAVINRYKQLHKGEKIVSSYEYYNTINISTKVKVPSSMSIGELKGEIERIEQEINKNSKLNFKFEFSV